MAFGTFYKKKIEWWIKQRSLEVLFSSLFCWGIPSSDEISIHTYTTYQTGLWTHFSVRHDMKEIVDIEIHKSMKSLLKRSRARDFHGDQDEDERKSQI